MPDLPPPLVPPECSTSGNDWFPFYFDRLRKSKWWRRATDLARSRNVMMWGEAFKSTPAGSLPDDDDELAEAAGYGMDVEAFIASRAEIMAPWVLCSDGRWYHPTVCEVVLDAWERTSDRKRAAAERQRRRRDRVRGVTPPNDSVTRQSTTVTRDNSQNERDFDIQTVQTGQDSKDADASLSPVSDAKPEYPDEFEIAWKAYPHVKGRSSKSKSFGYWRRITAPRRALLPSAIARYSREGREPRDDCGAPAMDRWLRDQRYLDWLDPDASERAPPVAWAGPADVLDAVLRHRDRDWAVYHLSRCRWDADARTLAAEGLSASLLRREAEGSLRAIGVTIVEIPAKPQPARVA